MNSLSRVRGRWLLLTLAYTAFIIYGSLVPLDFQANSLHAAWATFLRLPWAVQRQFSWTDWITNVMLYVPLAILGRGTLSVWGKGGILLPAGLVWLGCIALSVGVEFAQTFTASRTPLFGDILANGLGAAIGILLSPAAGPRLGDLLAAVSAHASRPCPTVLAARLPAGLSLLPYLGLLAWFGGWFESAWLPPRSALERLAELHLAPFYQQYFADIGLALRSVVTVMAAFAPMGLTVWALHRRSVFAHVLLRRAAFWGFLAAGFLESGRLFLVNRQPDYTNLLFAALGAMLGCMLACALFSSAWKTPTRGSANPAVGRSRPRLGWRWLAWVAFLAALVGLWDQPFAQIPLAVGALLYVLLLLRYPHAWLVVVPALLPVLDLAPWSGRFFLDEFDLLLLLTSAVGYGHASGMPAGRTRLPSGLVFVLGLFATSYLISLAAALFPFATLDLNSFAHYYSHYNALRVAKGFLWALVLLPLLVWQLRAGIPVGRLFALGMVLGLAGEVLAVVWERAVFPGLTDFTRDFRVAGLMSSMHTGGSHIEAYLVLSLPFLAAVVAGHRGWLAPLVGLGLLLGGLYALAVTFARGGYVATGLVMLVLAAGWLLRGSQAASRQATPYILAASLLAGLIVVPIIGGPFAQYRLAQIGHDAEVRMGHWQEALGIKDKGWWSELFGMGPGRYPVTYFYRSQPGARPASFSYIDHGGHRGLSLGAGTPVYVEQKVRVRHGIQYRLEIVARSVHSNAKLNVLLCERTFFDSFGCTSATFPLTETWQVFKDRLALTWAGGWGRPVTLSLENSTSGSVAEIRSIALLDSAGQEVIRNGDFAQGADRWFFSAFDHLAWHIKNLWVDLLFSLGWVGLTAFTLFVAYGLTQLSRHFLRLGDVVTLSALAGLVGFMTVSSVDSLFDAPRLTLLFFLTLLLGVLHTAPRGGRVTKRAQEERHRPDLRRTATQARHGAEAVANAGASMPLFWRDVVLGVGVVAALGVAATYVPGVPYNLRELIYEGSPLLSALLLSLSWFWVAGVPVILAHGLTVYRWFQPAYPFAALLHAAVAAGLVMTAVPTESIHDVVGSPILGWPGELESLARLTVLLGAICLLLTGGAYMAGAVVRRRWHVGVWAWGGTALLMLALAHWVIVEQAATDNLTELMAGGGGIKSSAALTACVLLLSTVGSLIGMFASGRGLSIVATVVWAMLALPLSYGLLLLATETAIVKYDQRFSALQFLLSADRANLASGVELALRYGLACLGGLLALAFAQRPFVRLAAVKTAARTASASARREQTSVAAQRATDAGKQAGAASRDSV